MPGFQSDNVYSKYWSTGPEHIDAAMHDPNPKPGRVKTVQDMSEQEIEQLEQQYGCKVNRNPLTPDTDV